MTALKQHPASFRDPAGFVYQQEETVYRFVSKLYQKQWEQLNTSGLYEMLVQKELLIPVKQSRENHWNRPDWLTTLIPEKIPFLNYAWEWSFEQMKDAALSTLAVCKTALQHQMILKDAVHFNIHFVKGKPLFIDSLSFELYEEGQAWVAYQQFCECFLNPLLLAAYTPIELNCLMLSYPQGIAAAVTASVLPWKTRLQTGILLHVHLRAKITGQKKPAAPSQTKSLSRKGLLHILQSLETLIEKLQPCNQLASVWNHYYEDGILSNEYLLAKKKMVTEWLEQRNYQSILDFGTNNGEFALLCKPEVEVVAIDMDSACINSLYQTVKKEKRKNLLPLVVDLSAPPPSAGWDNLEQPAFFKRNKFDAGMALALVHHLAIGKNISFHQMAAFFAGQCEQLLIEWVPKEDQKAGDMLRNRKDIFENYHINSFEESFTQTFRILKKDSIPHSNRILYLMERK